MNNAVSSRAGCPAVMSELVEEATGVQPCIGDRVSYTQPRSDLEIRRHLAGEIRAACVTFRSQSRLLRTLFLSAIVLIRLRSRYRQEVEDERKGKHARSKEAAVN